MKTTFYKKYKKLYQIAQTTGAYKLYLFEVQNSQTHLAEKEYYNKMEQFTTAITKELLKLEHHPNTQILHRHTFAKNIKPNKNQVLLLQDQSNLQAKDVAYMSQINPLFFGTNKVSFVVNKHAILDEQFYSIVQKQKDRIIPNYNLNHVQACYQTDDWNKSGSMFCRTSCLQTLLELVQTKQASELVSPEQTK